MLEKFKALLELRPQGRIGVTVIFIEEKGYMKINFHVATSNVRQCQLVNNNAKVIGTSAKTTNDALIAI
ncbi:hypothetical protein [Methylovulum psychrotolerans]|uniref:hypothetical protein n=1 Tax=Methylovulum psychrotolerans TaxID=1704499 RepID=UPI000CDEDCC0|nr:hypothetical protein [Methylovulum psychrotolerans]